MEIAEEILEELPRFMLVEAMQAAERGDEECPACGETVADPDHAALLVYPDEVWFSLALAHRRCQRSRMLEDGNPLIEEMSPDTFGLAWRLHLRDQPPRAVLLWENKANFDAVPSFEDVGSVDGGPGWLGYALRREGFAVVEEDLDTLDPILIADYVLVGRGDGIELRSGAVHAQSFPGLPRSAWQATAEQEGEVLLVYGTALHLVDFDSDHLGRRAERGKVIAGVVRYLRREGTVLHSLETAPRDRGTEQEVLPGGVGATLALAPLPQEVSEASRLGLITPKQFARKLVRHVQAEMRRKGELTRADLERGQRRRGKGLTFQMVAVAVVVDLVIAAAVLWGSGHL